MYANLELIQVKAQIFQSSKILLYIDETSEFFQIPMITSSLSGEFSVNLSLEIFPDFLTDARAERNLFAESAKKARHCSEQSLLKGKASVITNHLHSPYFFSPKSSFDQPVLELKGCPISNAVSFSKNL